MRKKIEEAVKILNLNSDVSFDMQYWEDTKGNMVHVSESCKRITGFSSREFIESSELARSIILSEDIAKWDEHYETAKKGINHVIQFRIKHKDGNIVWIEHVCQKLYDEEGNFQGFRGSNRDITDRKISEEIFRTSPSVFFHWENKEGWPVAFVSENVRRLSGYTKEDFLSNKISYVNIVHGDDIERVSEEVKTFSDMELEEFEHKPYRIKTKSGEIKWVDDRTNIKRDENGKITHYQGSVTDISKKVNTELLLKKSEEKWRSLTQNSADYILLLDLNYNIQFINHTVPDLTVEQVIGKSNFEFVPLDYHAVAKECFDRVVKNGKPDRYETKYITADGETQYFDVRISPLKDDDGTVTGLISNSNNNTASRQAEVKLRKLLDEKEERAKELQCIYGVTESIRKQTSIDQLFMDVINLIPAGWHYPDITKGRVVFDGKEFISEKFEKTDCMQSSDIIVNGEIRGAIEVFYLEKCPELDEGPFMIEERNLIDGIAKNISEAIELKYIEKSLRESEELYRSVFNHSPLGIFHFDTEGVITDCNEEFVRIIGSSLEVLIGLNIPKQLKDQKMIKEIKRTLKNGSAYYDGYYSSVTAQKNTPIVIHFNGIYDSNNIIIGGVGLIEDVTERKIAEKTASEQKFILDNMNDFIYRQNIDGTFAYISPGLTKIVGFSPEEWKTHYENVITDNPINQNVINNTEDALLKGIIHPPYEVEVHHKSGSRVMLEVSEVPILEIGKVVGLIGIARDITEKMKSGKLQKALYRISEEAQTIIATNEFYKSLHEIVKDLMPAKNFYIAIHNTDKDIISFPYYVDEKDTPPSPQLSGNGLTEYVLKTKKSQILTETDYRELQQKKEVELSESGKFSKIWIGIYLDFDGNHKGVLALQDYNNENSYSVEDLKVLQFVSEQIVKVLDKEYAEAKLKQYVKDLFNIKEELELINSNKDRFFSIIAHDLRSPFMALMGISQMISEDMDSMSVGEVKEMTGAIYHSTQNLNKLIENLLKWSRLQMGTFEITPKEININEISKNVSNILQLSAKEKNITIVDSITETAVYADEDCAKTILRNLVNNAIKFTEKGGEIKLSSKQVKAFVEVTIEDNGVGIKESVIKKLFRITEKVSEAGTEKEVGTGLGLILCKELVEKNGGKIWVESEFEKGSKFTFTLPTKAR